MKAKINRTPPQNSPDHNINYDNNNNDGQNTESNEKNDCEHTTFQDNMS